MYIYIYIYSALLSSLLAPLLSSLFSSLFSCLSSSILNCSYKDNCQKQHKQNMWKEATHVTCESASSSKIFRINACQGVCLSLKPPVARTSLC